MPNLEIVDRYGCVNVLTDITAQAADVISDILSGRLHEVQTLGSSGFSQPIPVADIREITIRLP